MVHAENWSTSRMRKTDSPTPRRLRLQLVCGLISQNITPSILPETTSLLIRASLQVHQLAVRAGHLGGQRAPEVGGIALVVGVVLEGFAVDQHRFAGEILAARMVSFGHGDSSR